jgi:DNA primase large subunit
MSSKAQTLQEMDEEELIKLRIKKEKRIKKEITRLTATFKKIDKESKNTVVSLIRNAAFMTITLEDLEEQMNINGVVSEYQNGENQFGTKKSPEVEIYNTMIKNQMNIIKQLTDLLPKQNNPAGEDGDGFDEFIEIRD